MPLPASVKRVPISHKSQIEYLITDWQPITGLFLGLFLLALYFYLYINKDRTYKVIELIGTSTNSWEKAAATVVERVRPQPGAIHREHLGSSNTLSDILSMRSFMMLIWRSTIPSIFLMSRKFTANVATTTDISSCPVCITAQFAADLIQLAAHLREFAKNARLLFGEKTLIDVFRDLAHLPSFFFTALKPPAPQAGELLRPASEYASRSSNPLQPPCYHSRIPSLISLAILVPRIVLLYR